MKAEKATARKMSNPINGTHPARLIGIIDLGLQPPFKQGDTPKKQFDFTYELVNSFVDDDPERPHFVSETVNNIFNGIDSEYASKLDKRAAALGANPEDMGTFLDKACMVTTKLKNDWPRIEAVSGIPSGYTVPPMVNPVYLFDLTDPCIETFNKLPKFKQERVMKNLNFEGSLLQQRLDLQEARNSENDLPF